MVTRKPVRGSGSHAALKAVQVAFDVDETVMEAVRRAAFANQRSPSAQIRHILKLEVARPPKRPRLTVSLNQHDYQLLGGRYRLPADDRRAIKEKVTQELIAFSFHTRRHSR